MPLKLQQRKTQTVSQKMIDDKVSVSEVSGSEDELLLEFGDASDSEENDSDDSEREEENELPEGDRVNRYGRKVGNWRWRYSN